jgi:hypothetical protein
MGGLVIDIFIEFFFRTIANSIRRSQASNWPIVTAIASDSERRGSDMGCTVIVIHYKYRNAEKRYEGTHKEPFLFSNYAKAYLDRFPGGTEFSVRVNPHDPSKSVAVRS